jgi:hypothetical protein
MRDGRVEVEDVGRRVFGVEVRVESLHQGRLALNTSGEDLRGSVCLNKIAVGVRMLTDPAMPMTTIQMGCFFLVSAAS